MINPWLICACIIAILGAGAGGFQLGADHEIAAHAREQEHIAAAIDAANKAAAEAISNIRVVNTTVQNEVQHEIRTNTIYGDCKHSPSGLQLINKSLGGPEPLGGSKLPAADATP